MHKHPKKLEDKKFRELVIGWLLIQFFCEKDKRELLIALPLKPDKYYHNETEQITVELILERYDKFIEDRDVDIFVGKEENWLKCQITRFYNHPGNVECRIVDIIAKKCKEAPTDKNLTLVVNIESSPNITFDELREIPRIPFGQILLIMKASSERGHFTCCQLYPKPLKAKEIWVPLPV